MRNIMGAKHMTYRQFSVLSTRVKQILRAPPDGCTSTSAHLPKVCKCQCSDSTHNEIPGTYHSKESGDIALFRGPSESNIFVPKCCPVSYTDLELFEEFVNSCKKLIVLTGAGISTESGIPDYRSEGVGLYARSTNRPVQYQDFVKYPEIRQRYWARNYVGWPKFGFFLPNRSHMALSEWEKEGRIHWLVTQNVDALHYKAGSRKVTELHGSAHRVMCLGCDHKMTRPEMQLLIKSHNPNWTAESQEMAPDADVQLTPEQIQGFKVTVHNILFQCFP